MENEISDKSQASDELVFGLVAPLGTDLELFEATIKTVATQFSYTVHAIKASNLISELDTKAGSWLATFQITGSTETERKIEIGTLLRRQSELKDLFARFAVDKIRLEANRKNREQNPRRLFIVSQLKRPEEVNLLKSVYGKSFFLIGVQAPEDERERNLQRNRQIPEEKAKQLILKDADEKEDKDYGQQTSDTFQLADLFISDTASCEELERFFDLIFGSPLSAARAEEYYMFLAFSASLRSADLSRQVGAVIVSENENVIAIGANDVPKFGGGQYWPGPSDQRDYKQGYDANYRRREEIVQRIANALEQLGTEFKTSRLKITDTLRKTEIKDLIEFMRPVHAEMESLMACARSGVSTKGARLFCTTFPCHNCAKHLVSAGISEVFYVEPYAKSLACDLHSDSIRVDDANGTSNSHLLFRPFKGVGPRRFMDLFSMSLGAGSPLVRKDKSGKILSYSRPTATHRFKTNRLYQSELELAEAGEFTRWLSKIVDSAIKSA